MLGLIDPTYIPGRNNTCSSGSILSYLVTPFFPENLRAFKMDDKRLFLHMMTLTPAIPLYTVLYDAESVGCRRSVCVVLRCFFEHTTMDHTHNKKKLSLSLSGGGADFSQYNFGIIIHCFMLFYIVIGIYCGCA
jgi:hypothetical protein